MRIFHHKPWYTVFLIMFLASLILIISTVTTASFANTIQIPEELQKSSLQKKLQKVTQCEVEMKDSKTFCSDEENIKALFKKCRMFWWKKHEAYNLPDYDIRISLDTDNGLYFDFFKDKNIVMVGSKNNNYYYTVPREVYGNIENWVKNLTNNQVAF